MADSEDTIVDAQLAKCASIRETVLATLRNSEKATEKYRAAVRHLEQTTKQCHETLRDVDEFTNDLKNRRFDKLDQIVENLENRRVKGDDGRKNGNTPHTSFKHASAVQQSRLLSLAPEIRNMIWKLCLFHPDNIVTTLSNELIRVPKKYGCLTMTITPNSIEARPKLIEAYETSTARRTRRSIREHSLRNLGLMETCQDVYNETAPMLWSQRFYFHSIMHLQAFLFSNARLDLVRDICVWNLDRQFGINYMPAVSALLADKVKGLERFDVDMSNMDKSPSYHDWYEFPPHTEQEIQAAGAELGFDVYSCMHPWVTKVVRGQGIEKLMAVLQIPRERKESLSARIIGEPLIPTHLRAHYAFRHSGKLSKNEQNIADAAAAAEIVRLVNLYDK